MNFKYEGGRYYTPASARGEGGRERATSREAMLARHSSVESTGSRASSRAQLGRHSSGSSGETSGSRMSRQNSGRSRGRASVPVLQSATETPLGPSRSPRRDLGAASPALLASPRDLLLVKTRPPIPGSGGSSRDSGGAGRARRPRSATSHHGGSVRFRVKGKKSAAASAAAADKKRHEDAQSMLVRTVPRALSWLARDWAGCRDTRARVTFALLAGCRFRPL